MILSSNMLFAFFSILLDDITGQVFMFYILSIAAAETAIGLSLVIAYYRSYRYI
jgi:NADH-quinone oxidoreductase subunit K